MVDGETAIRVWDMPTTDALRSKTVCASLLSDILADAAALGRGRCTVVLERVGAMPGQGVTSMFRFGHSLGVVEGVVGARHLPLARVSPSVWKRRAKLIGKPKDCSRALALELFPELSSEFSRKKDCGRADAALIALFGGLELEP